MKRNVLLAVAGLALSTGVASAQWSDNFDSYPTGVNINGLGGWQGWGNVPAQAPVTSNAQAFSGPNSIFVSGQGATGGAGYSDNVHQYSGYSSGFWEYSAKMFVPSNATGNAYFILLNQYADPAGPNNWSIEYLLNATAGTMSDDFSTTHGNVGATPLIRGAWTDITVVMDLTNNWQTTWYNGNFYCQGAWKTSATSTLNLAAVDLYSDTSSGVYFDNLSLRQVPSPAGASVLALGGLLAMRRRRA